MGNLFSGLRYDLANLQDDVTVADRIEILKSARENFLWLKHKYGKMPADLTEKEHGPIKAFKEHFSIVEDLMEKILSEKRTDQRKVYASMCVEELGKNRDMLDEYERLISEYVPEGFEYPVRHSFRARALLEYPDMLSVERDLKFLRDNNLVIDSWITYAANYHGIPIDAENERSDATNALFSTTARRWLPEERWVQTYRRFKEIQAENSSITSPDALETALSEQRSVLEHMTRISMTDMPDTVLGLSSNLWLLTQDKYADGRDELMKQAEQLFLWADYNEEILSLGESSQDEILSGMRKDLKCLKETFSMIKSAEDEKIFKERANEAFIVSRRLMGAVVKCRDSVIDYVPIGSNKPVGIMSYEDMALLSSPTKDIVLNKLAFYKKIGMEETDSFLKVAAHRFKINPDEVWRHLDTTMPTEELVQNARKTFRLFYGEQIRPNQPSDGVGKISTSTETQKYAFSYDTIGSSKYSSDRKLSDLGEMPGLSRRPGGLDILSSFEEDLADMRRLKTQLDDELGTHFESPDRSTGTKGSPGSQPANSGESSSTTNPAVSSSVQFPPEANTSTASPSGPAIGPPAEAKHAPAGDDAMGRIIGGSALLEAQESRRRYQETVDRASRKDDPYPGPPPDWYYQLMAFLYGAGMGIMDAENASKNAGPVSGSAIDGAASPEQGLEQTNVDAGAGTGKMPDSNGIIDPYSLDEEDALIWEARKRQTRDRMLGVDNSTPTEEKKKAWEDRLDYVNGTLGGVYELNRRDNETRSNLAGISTSSTPEEKKDAWNERLKFLNEVLSRSEEKETISYSKPSEEKTEGSSDEFPELIKKYKKDLDDLTGGAP
jgi:hypothetical protein